MAMDTLLAVTETLREPHQLRQVEATLRPPGSDANLGLYLRRLFAMRRFAWVAARSELESGASGTLLGRVWLLLGPILGIFTYWILFDVLLGASNSVNNYLAFLTVGLVVFEHSRAGVTNASGAIVRQTALLRSLSFPRAVVPLIETFNSAANAAISLFVTLLALPVMGVMPRWSWLGILPLFVVQTAMNYGLGMLLVRPMTRFADLRQALTYIFRLIFYGSGVLVPMNEYVSPFVLDLLVLNPFYCLCEFARWALLGTKPENLAGTFFSTGLWTVVSLIVGVLVFFRGERSFSGVRTITLSPVESGGATAGPTRSRWSMAARVAVALPLVSYGLALIAVLTNGQDLPGVQGWQVDGSGRAGTLTPEYLFDASGESANPVGKVFDSLAFRAFRGNEVAYTFVSMLLVTGGLLALQWRLISITVRRRVLVVTAFGATLLMLQPGGPWTRIPLAYHDALPLVALLGMLWLLVADEVNERVLVIGLFVLSLLGGLAYVNGAVSNLALLGTAAVASLYFTGTIRHRFRLASFALIIPTAAALIVQLRAVLANDPADSLATAGWSRPWEADYWLFASGKLARSLFLPTRWPLVSFVAAVVALALLTACFGASVRTLARARDQHIAEIRLPLIVQTLGWSSLFYLLFVSAQRANLRPSGMSRLEIFSFGAAASDYLFLTLLSPWLLLWIAGAMNSAFSRLTSRKIMLATLGAMAILTAVGIMDHFG